MTVKKWETTVHPYSSLTPDNTMELTIYKTANICTAFVMWTGSTGDETASLAEISIPEEFRPPINAYGYTPAIVGRTQQQGGTRILLKPDGGLSFTTNDKGFVERRVTISYVCE